ncbi:MAG: hypothetical protein ACP5PJ_09650 [Acidimicrobiales bacterium]
MNQRLQSSALEPIVACITEPMTISIAVDEGDLAPGWTVELHPTGAQAVPLADVSDLIIHVNNQTAHSLVQGELGIDEALRHGEIRFAGDITSLRRVESVRTRATAKEAP